MARARSSLLLALPLAVALAGQEANADAPAADDEAMIELAWDSGCFNCHDLHERVRGPAWTEVARRYRDDEDAFERLVQTVIEGGSGNWGEDAMSPNRRVPEEDVRTLVAWLLSLE
jgi:cytochrome c